MSDRENAEGKAETATRAGLKKSILGNYCVLLISGVFSHVLLLAGFACLASRLSSEYFGIFNFNIAIVTFGFVPNVGLMLFATSEVARGRDSPRFVTSMLALRLALALVMLGGLSLAVLVLVPQTPHRWAVVFMATALLWQALYLDWFFNGRGRMLTTALCNAVNPLVFLPAVVYLVFQDGDFLVLSAIYSAGYLGVSVGGFLAYIRQGFALQATPDVRLWKSTFALSSPVAVAFMVAHVYASLDVLMLRLLKGPEAVAGYSAAYRLIVPINAVGLLFVNVTFPVLSRLLAGSDSKRLESTISLVVRLLIVCVLPVVVFMGMRAPETLGLLYPQEYTRAAVVLRILSGTLLFIWVGAVYSRLLMAAGDNKRYLLAVSVAAGANVVLNAILIPFLDINGAALATMTAELSTLLLMYRFARRRVAAFSWRFLARPLCAGCCMALVIVFGPGSFLLNTALACGVYVAAALLLRTLTWRDLTLLREW